MKFLPVDSQGRVPIDAAGQPMHTTAPSSQDGVADRSDADSVVVRVRKEPELWAFLASEVSAAHIPADRWVGARHFAAHAPEASADVTRAIALIRHRVNTLYHPRSGGELTFPGTGVVGLDKAGQHFFPRLDPAVIVMVKHPEAEKILLGRNAMRPDFYSFVAGYVDLGESLEDACQREVLEEAGFHIDDVQYWGSAPWALSGSIMLAFHARATHVRTVGNTDGELIDVRWVEKDELPELPLARQGSIARAMMMEWLASE